MDASILLPAITTALSVGLGCGACCSPVISVFLSTYVVSHSDGVKRGVAAFASFFLGKTVSVTLMCMAAAFVSKQFLGADGYIGNFNLRLATRLVMSGIGLLMAVKWVFDNKRQQQGCKGCHECGNKKQQPKSGILPMLSAGLTYGFTPCAPLVMMIGYSFTLPIAIAGAMGSVFSVASAASPVLLLVVISGVLSRKLKQELPQFLKWFRLASYLLLAVMPFVINRY